MLRHPLLLKSILLLYLACLVGLLTAYFVISAMEIPYAAHLQGPHAFVPGKAHAFRGRLLHAQTNLPLSRVHAASLTLTSPTSTHPLGAPAVGQDGRFTLQHLLPTNVPPGSYTLTLEVVVSPSEPTFTASAPVTVAPPDSETPAHPLASDSRYPPDVRKLRRGIYEDTGDVSIHIVPAHGELPRGLKDTVYLLTTERATGKPLPCTLSFAHQEGALTPTPPPTLRTGKLGYVALPVEARGTLQWELQASCAQDSAPQEAPLLGAAKVQWLTVASQVSLLQLQPLASESLRANFASIYRQAVVYADLYDPTGHWLWTGTFGVRDRQGGIQIPVPPNAQGPLRLQLSHQHFDLRQSWDMRAFSTQPDPPSAIAHLLAAPASVEGASAWATWLHDHLPTLDLSPTQHARLLPLLLRAQPITRQDAAVLIHSAVKDRADLDRWKDSVRPPLLGLIVAAMALGLLALLLAIFKGIAQGKARQRLYDEVAMELDHAPAPPPSQRLFLVQMIVVVGTLMLFAASMIFLLLLL